MTVDTRATGTGAGNVYVTMTRLANYYSGSSAMQLVVCDNGLVNCSPPETVSGDPNITLSRVQVIPSGGSAGTVTISYINVASGRNKSGLTGYRYQIKRVVCTPNGAPNAPTCSAPTLVYDEHPSLVGDVSGLANSSLHLSQACPSRPRRLHRDVRDMGQV